MEYRVLRAYSGKFALDQDGQTLIFQSKKKNKKQAILTGDIVKVENEVITQVLPRKNKLIRPPIANVDQLVLVICPIPQPDLYMLDKMLINCKTNNINPIICINKTDITSEQFVLDIVNQYSHYQIIFTNALNQDALQLIPLLKGKLTCLAGQSAVGKSTLINTLLGNDLLKTDGLTSFNRGKNTTTNTQLYKINDGLIADTPGFSLLDIFDVDAYSLDLYYPEFDQLLNKCKFHRCTHTGEPDCAIQQAVTDNKVNQQRFLRYKELFTQLKSKKTWREK